MVAERSSGGLLMKYALGLILAFGGFALLWASDEPQKIIDYFFETDAIETFARDRLFLESWEWLNSSVWFGLKEEFSRAVKGAIGLLFMWWGLAMAIREYTHPVTEEGATKSKGEIAVLLFGGAMIILGVWVIFFEK